MAPNRRAKNEHHGGNGGNGGGHGQGQGGGPVRNNHGNNQGMSKPLKCVRPKGCLDPKRMIYMEDVESGAIEVVRLTCNNLQCEQGNYMHLECFQDWETTVLNFLSSTGRARSWSVKQRQQNLWTKKGYDLAFKACDCNCGKGHLRKDLDWIPPTEKPDRARNQQQQQGVQQDERNAALPQNQNPQQNGNNHNHIAGGAGTQDKKKKKKGKENLPTLALSAPVPHPNDNYNRRMSVSSNAANGGTAPAPSSTPIKTGNGTGSSASDPNSSPPSSGIGSFGSDQMDSPSPPSSTPWNVPDSLCRPRVNSVSSNASGSSGAFSGTSGSPPSPEAQFGFQLGSALDRNVFKFQRKGSCSSGGERDRTRLNSTGSLFSRRSDFSSFNVLPRHKQNSYNIKMDDDGHGNDDMRYHVLTTLQNHRMTKIGCCMCQSSLVIYDRYPLIDGTFFISPKKYNKECVPMLSEGVNSTRFLSAICMQCLSGKNGGMICRNCGKAFDTTVLIIGAIYSYDVFAAMPCCAFRTQCLNCHNPQNQDSYKFFHQASSLQRCERCGYVEYHCIKPLEYCFVKVSASQFDTILKEQKVEEIRKLMLAAQLRGQVA